MEFKKLEEYGKGDICLEVLVERSSTRDSVTISLWKNQDGKFQVALCDEKVRGKERWKAIRPFRENETRAREWYENYCHDNGHLPYPEAEAYYRRKGLLRD